MISVLARSRSGHDEAPAGRLEARPLYSQVRDLLVRQIIEGQWKPGSYLPSEPQLAAEFGVSIGTIRKATEDLASQGLLERQPGRGTRVSAHSSANSRFRFLRFVHPDGRPLEPVARLIARSMGKPTPQDRLHLALAPRDSVVVLTRTRSERGVPLIFERIALPAGPFRKLKLRKGEDMTEEVYVLYQEQCGVTIVGTRDQVSLGFATVPMAQHLAVAVGAPMLAVRRVAFALDGRRAEYRESWTAALAYETDLD